MSTPKKSTISKLNPFEPVQTDTDTRDATPTDQTQTANTPRQEPAPTATDETARDEETDGPEDDRYLDRATD